MALSDNYTSEIQSKRIDKGSRQSELQLLAQMPEGFAVSHADTPFGLIITTSLAQTAFPDQLPLDVVLEIHIEGKFPFQAPKVLCKTSFCAPSLADGRDLLRDIIGSQWTPSLTMNQLTAQFPGFIVNPTQKQTRLLHSSRIGDLGVFHLGHPMYLATWDNHPRMRAFTVMEVEGSSSDERVLAVTETAILVLDNNPKFEGIGQLLSWATLPSIENITKSKTEPNRLTFQWKEMGDQPPFSQVFYVPESESLIALVNENIFRLGSSGPQDWIAEDEVTASALDRVAIDDVLQSIDLYETYVSEARTPDTMTKLLSLYQQAVEYYSAINDPKFSEYLEKMHSMLTNESVLQTLSPR